MPWSVEVSEAIKKSPCLIRTFCCWTAGTKKKKGKQKNLWEMKSELSYHLISRLQCITKISQWHHVSVSAKLLPRCARPLRHRDQVGARRCPRSTGWTSSWPHSSAAQNPGNARRWCLIYLWFPNTSEVFCFHKISVALMLGWDCNLF